MAPSWRKRAPPVFYLAYGIPDTVNGRLDVLMLHLAMAFERLSQGDDEAKAAGQETFDRFCRDMDDHLREDGISDMKVPKAGARAWPPLSLAATALIYRPCGQAMMPPCGLRSAVTCSRAPSGAVGSAAGGLHAGRNGDAGSAGTRRVIATGKIAWPDPDTISA